MYSRVYKHFEHFRLQSVKERFCFEMWIKGFGAENGKNVKWKMQNKAIKKNCRRRYCQTQTALSVLFGSFIFAQLGLGGKSSKSGLGSDRWINKQF